MYAPGVKDSRRPFFAQLLQQYVSACIQEIVAAMPFQAPAALLGTGHGQLGYPHLLTLARRARRLHTWEAVVIAGFKVHEPVNLVFWNTLSTGQRASNSAFQLQAAMFFRLVTALPRDVARAASALCDLCTNSSMLQSTSSSLAPMASRSGPWLSASLWRMTSSRRSTRAGSGAGHGPEPFRPLARAGAAFPRPGASCGGWPAGPAAHIADLLHQGDAQHQGKRPYFGDGQRLLLLEGVGKVNQHVRSRLPSVGGPQFQGQGVNARVAPVSPVGQHRQFPEPLAPDGERSISRTCSSTT